MPQALLPLVWQLSFGRTPYWVGDGMPVILLTRFDNSKILVNLESIRYLESTPDTLIHFTNGDSLLVRETLQEFEERVIDYKVRILARLDQEKSKS